MLQMLTNIDVEDIRKASDFYCKALGLKIGRRFGSSSVELLGASSPIYLLQKPSGSIPAARASNSRNYSRHWTPVHLDFVVPDLEAALQTAQAAGAMLEGKIRTANWGRIAMLADPFGHGFCLIQFLGRGYDEIANS